MINTDNRYTYLQKNGYRYSYYKYKENAIWLNWHKSIEQPQSKSSFGTGMVVAKNQDYAQLRL